MTSAAASVTSIKASIKTMQTYFDNVDTWYSTYNSRHSADRCDPLEGNHMHGDIETAKLAVENVILKLKDHLEDTEWIAQLREHKGKWSQAERECAQADTEVTNKKLTAQESWQGDAGNGYRQNVTAQQGAIASAERAASIMTYGCENGAYAGEAYFSAVDAALKTCVGGLPTEADFPPWSGVRGDSNPGSQTAQGHGDIVKEKCKTHAKSSGKSAATTCKTSVEEAVTTLVESFTDAFKTYPMYAYPYGGSRPNLSVGDVTGKWPTK